MRDINLLPPKQRSKRLALSLVTYTTVGFILLLITIGGFALTLTTIQVTINDKIDNYALQRGGIEKHIASFKTLEQDVTTINKTLTLASTALDAQLHPSPIIQMVSNHIGPDLTFTSITVDHPAIAAKSTAPSGTEVVVAGSAKERANIIDFKRGLETEKQFQNITYTIASTSASAAATTSKLTFTLNLTVTKDSTK